MQCVSAIHEGSAAQAHMREAKIGEVVSAISHLTCIFMHGGGGRPYQVVKSALETPAVNTCREVQLGYLL